MDRRRDIGRMQPRPHAVNAGRKGSRVLPECQNIACMEFLYVLMRESQATAGFAIYNARPIGQVSKCRLGDWSLWSGRVQAARTRGR